MKSRKSKQDSGEAYSLVYSTDPQPPKRCAGCHQVECICPKNVVVGPLKPALRIERKGRGGKTVTVVSKLPPHETFLKELCAHLKKSIGSGGTSYIEAGQGCIEIQGEWVEQLVGLIATYAPRK